MRAVIFSGPCDITVGRTGRPDQSVDPLGAEPLGRDHPAQTDGAVARPLPTADSGVMGHQVADPGSDRCDKGDRDDDLDQR